MLDSKALDPVQAELLAEEIKLEASLIDDSPFPEVRSVVTEALTAAQVLT